MKIALDLMGADQPPGVLLEGVYRYAHDHRDEDELFVLVSKGEVVRDSSSVRVVYCDEVVKQEDEPTVVLRKRDSTMCKGLEMVASGEVEGLISFGNTGALVIGGVAYVKRLEAHIRPAICVAMPSVQGSTWVFVDAGANADVDPADLLDFAAYGCAYYKSLEGHDAESVALLNVGKERHKGSELIKEAAQLMADVPEFVGFVEPDQLLLPAVNVVVTWGLLGNIFLKTAEGVLEVVKHTLKDISQKGLKEKIGLGLVKGNLYQTFKKFDYRTYGVSPILGLKGNVLKGHGKSDPEAVYNALRTGKLLMERNTIGAVKEELIRWREKRSSRS